MPVFGAVAQAIPAIKVVRPDRAAPRGVKIIDRVKCSLAKVLPCVRSAVPSAFIWGISTG